MNDMRQMTSLGRKIENNSFSIIDKEAGPHSHPPGDWEVVRRIIHATADFEYRDLTKVHPKAIQEGIKALKKGCPIICDVQMIIAGLNIERLNSYRCKTYSFISDPEVIQIAKENNSTRAIESMKKAANLGLLEGAVIAIGNAPTALLEIVRLVQEERIRPALVIGVPVGFVSAAESKEALLDEKFQSEYSIPYILTRGRKGGSTIAVSIIHALLLLSTEKNS
ncbi:precorrin-8X methylmutase [Leptospira sarikeiensis]|uniref:Precorrin-8X methylmutase n=1 Tax=Leptospira sarikeiensis TaxID=2484943 RepID=A0A4R9JYR7_9LEPT|nr:precorrin-8X methylmutase [Leptospira sarikeiensis]TGL58417.1 precorrin-8X methylmutase [Leptospira sarikeiensis]